MLRHTPAVHERQIGYDRVKFSFTQVEFEIANLLKKLSELDKIIDINKQDTCKLSTENLHLKSRVCKLEKELHATHSNTPSKDHCKTIHPQPVEFIPSDSVTPRDQSKEKVDGKKSGKSKQDEPKASTYTSTIPQKDPQLVEFIPSDSVIYQDQHKETVDSRETGKSKQNEPNPSIYIPTTPLKDPLSNPSHKFLTTDKLPNNRDTNRFGNLPLVKIKANNYRSTNQSEPKSPWQSYTPRS